MRIADLDIGRLKLKVLKLPVSRGRRNFIDTNGDGLLNNGFESTAASGFSDNTVELPTDSVFSAYSLSDRAAR